MTNKERKAIMLHQVPDLLARLARYPEDTHGTFVIGRAKYKVKRERLEDPKAIAAFITKVNKAQPAHTFGPPAFKMPIAQWVQLQVWIDENPATQDDDYSAELAAIEFLSEFSDREYQLSRGRLYNGVGSYTQFQIDDNERKAAYTKLKQGKALATATVRAALKVINKRNGGTL